MTNNSLVRSLVELAILNSCDTRFRRQFSCLGLVLYDDDDSFASGKYPYDVGCTYVLVDVVPRRTIWYQILQRLPAIRSYCDIRESVIHFKVTASVRCSPAQCRGGRELRLLHNRLLGFFGTDTQNVITNSKKLQIEVVSAADASAAHP
jgi:hypothetical protein